MVHVAPNAPEGRRVHGAGDCPDVCPACALLPDRRKPRSTYARKIRQSGSPKVDTAMRDWLRRIDGK